MAVPVRIEGLTKTFGAVRAVDDLTLEIAPGDLFFLLGPSGCGKTTLLRCLAGFCRPERGRILIGNQDVTTLPAHARDTGMVFQSYALWPHMTVRENIAFGLTLRRLAKKEVAARVDAVLETVRLTPWAARKPNELSGGQQQRVALARAIAVRPRCLLLDEPLSNLDAKLRLEMRVEIRRLCKAEGLTAVYVTHDQKEALSVADRLAVLNNGAIEQTGAPEEVYRRPANRFVAAFIGETNFLGAEVTGFRSGQLHVHTAIGPLVGTHHPEGPLGAGDALTVCLRPEALRLGTPPAGCPNRFSGIVRNTVYLGEVAQHELLLPARGAAAQTGTHIPLKAFTINPRILARDGEAETELWVDPEDLVVLRPE